MLIRATRGCPWNRCGFCGMYKGLRFELRPVEDIIADIRTARALYGPGVRRAFIGDANSLVMPAADLARVVAELRAQFPALERVTSYARGHTLAKKRMEDLRLLRHAGLTRLHVGLETGSQRLLSLLEKGGTRAHMIEGGRKALEAGFELSEYVIIGLGGEEYWEEHAEETAAVLNEIGPHFIRVRTLAVLPGTPLHELRERGGFKPPRVLTVLAEEARLIGNLAVEGTYFASDHVSNLLPVEGRLRADQGRMIEQIELAMERVKGCAPEALLEDIRPAIVL